MQTTFGFLMTVVIQNFTLKATIKSPTELEIEVIDGAIQEDSIVSIGLDKLGVEKAITNRTFSDEYSKFIYDEAGRFERWKCCRGY